MRRGEVDLDRAAELSGYHKSHVCALAVMGRVKSRKVGHRRLVDARDLGRYVRERDRRDGGALFEDAQARLHDAVRLDMFEAHHEAAVVAGELRGRR